MPLPLPASRAASEKNVPNALTTFHPSTIFFGQAKGGENVASLMFVPTTLAAAQEAKGGENVASLM